MGEKKEKIEETKKRRKRRRRRITVGQLTIFIAIVIGVILFLIINAIMRNRYLKVENISGQYTMGEAFKITDYVRAVNDNAVLECDSSDFAPEEIGSYEIEYTVKCGKLKKTNTLTLEVVDINYPEIVGPDTLGVFLDEDVDLLDYYSVDDEEPNLEESLMINKVVDTGEVGTSTYTLYVTDWSNNSTSREISIRVYDLSGDTEKAARAVREYNKIYGYAVSGSKAYVYYPNEDSERCYVLVNGTDIFEIDEDKSCTLLEDEDDYDSLQETVRYRGTEVNVEGFTDFNYYSK